MKSREIFVPVSVDAVLAELDTALELLAEQRSVLESRLEGCSLEHARLAELRRHLEAGEDADVRPLYEFIDRYRETTSQYPLTNSIVIQMLLGEYGPLKVTALVERLKAIGHKLSSAANPLKAVSNELAVMVRKGLVERTPSGTYALKNAVSDEPSVKPFGDDRDPGSGVGTVARLPGRKRSLKTEFRSDDREDS